MNDLREWMQRRWPEKHASSAPLTEARSRELRDELAQLESFERAANVLACAVFECERAFESLFRARLAQYEYEREHPAPRGLMCLTPEDWAEIQAHPDVMRAVEALGPRLTPAVLDFLEAVERVMLTRRR